MTDAEVEILARVRVSASGCWEWSGRRHGCGYGWAPGKVLAHRWAWALLHGPIAPGLSVCHHCDNPPCVRPDHLFLGTHRDNMRDAAKKGRFPRRDGEYGRCRRLTWVLVDEIRALHNTGEWSLYDLGRKFRVDPSTIWSVVNRRSWTGPRE